MGWPEFKFNWVGAGAKPAGGAGAARCETGTGTGCHIVSTSKMTAYAGNEKGKCGFIGVSSFQLRRGYFF